MFLFFVCLVSMNLLMIRTEEVIVRIFKADQHRGCEVSREVTLHEGKDFTLQVQSDYFIKESSWIRKGRDQHLQDLENSKFGITYERIKSSGESNNTIVYNYSHIGTADHKSGGKWKFVFQLLRNYDPWSRPQHEDVHTITCSTHVQIVQSKRQEYQSTTSESPGAVSNSDVKDIKWLIPLVAVLGVLLCIQSAFMVFERIRSCKSNRNNDEDPLSPKSPKTKRGCKTRRTIADRPPLPLPLDEVVKQEPMPPVSPVTPMSPVPKHHLFPPASAPPMAVQNAYNGLPGGPIVPKQSFRNKALSNSDEDLRSPGFARRHLEVLVVPKDSHRNKFPKTLDGSDEELRTPELPRRQIGPIVPKQSYRKKAVDNSDEELRNPDFPRRHEDPLVPKQSFRNKVLDNSDEELRSPDFPRRHEGPLVPKQSYRNKALDISEEEPRTPILVRKQLEAKLAQLPPKGVTASKSFKFPTPAPPLYPKNLQLPSPAPCQPRSIVNPDSRLSDVDWQYETLQPASKYLDNFNETPYNNL